MPYFDTETKATLGFSIIGVIAGYASFLLNHTAGAAALGIVLFIIASFAAKKVLKIQEERKWWTTMAIVYFLVWFIVWSVYYNYILL